MVKRAHLVASQDRVATSRSGVLADTPLVHLLIELSATAAGGTLELSPPGGRRALLLVMAQGRPLRADAPGPYLGRMLFERGRVTQEQLDASLWALAKTKRLQGQILLESGAIDLAALREGLREQLAAKVREMLLLAPETRFAFHAGVVLVPARAGEDEHASIDPLPILWQSARDSAPEGHVRRLLAGCGALHVSAGAPIDRLRPTRDEQNVIDALRARPMTLPQLVAMNLLDSRTVERLAYVLLLAGFAQPAPPAPPSSVSGVRAAPAAPETEEPIPPPPPSSFPAERGTLDHLSFASPVAIPRQGAIANPVDPRAVLLLPLVRAPRPDQMDPIALAVLLARVLSQTHTSGTLLVECDGKTLTLPVQGGEALVARNAPAEIVEAFSWPRATFCFDATPPEAQGRRSRGLRRLAVQGLQCAMAGCGDRVFEEALGHRIDRAPRPRAAAEPRLRSLGLREMESRLVRFAFDGTSTVREILSRGGVSHQAVLTLLVILAAFECIDWVVLERPKEASRDQLVREVRERARRMQESNHFDALGVHWSAGDEEVAEAYGAVLREVVAGGPWDRAAPETCAAIRARAEAAWLVLRESRSRAAYRESAYPDLDADAAATVLEQRMRALSMRDDPASQRAARSAHLALRELRIARRTT